MWWHGPDNNAVSSDTAYRTPETVQWAGKPFFSTRIELPLVANGSLLVLWNGHAMDSSPGAPQLSGIDGEGPLLTARAVGSGVRLWARRLSTAAWAQAARSIMVADADDLLVADGGQLLLLDAATGQLRREPIDVGQPEIRWMTVADKRVLLIGGPTTPQHGHRSIKSVDPLRQDGLMLTCLDRKTLTVQWRISREKGDDALDPRSAAVSAGRVFVCTQGGQAEARCLADGKRVWRTSTGVDRPRPTGYAWDRSSRHPVSGYALAGVYIVLGTLQTKAVALAQSDGSRLWSAETPKQTQYMPLLFEELLWSGSRGRDPATGQEKRRLSDVSRSGCSRFTASPQGIIGNAGLTYDLLSERPVHPLSAKSACGAGQYVANGLVYHGGESPIIRLTAQNGTCRAAVANGHVKELATWDTSRWRSIRTYQHSYRSAKGQDVGALAPGWIVYGGRRLFTDQAESGTWRNDTHLICPDDQGTGRLPILYFEDKSARLPAWDDRDVLINACSRGRRGRPRFIGLILAEKRALLDLARKQMPDESTADILAKHETRHGGQSIPPEQIRRMLPVLSKLPGRWRAELPWASQAVSVALTSNAAVAAIRHRQNGQLRAWNRAGGQPLWQIDLPATPLHDGMAIAADGTCVVVLSDGSVLSVGVPEARTGEDLP